MGWSTTRRKDALEGVAGRPPPTTRCPHQRCTGPRGPSSLATPSEPLGTWSSSSTRHRSRCRPKAPASGPHGHWQGRPPCRPVPAASSRCLAASHGFALSKLKSHVPRPQRRAVEPPIWANLQTAPLRPLHMAMPSASRTTPRTASMVCIVDLCESVWRLAPGVGGGSWLDPKGWQACCNSVRTSCGTTVQEAKHEGVPAPSERQL
jgi:hypothetical protein